ncbi:MAG TPA: hypothetical protein VKT77_03505 [Chthonomonadaceae bacterium]|nr:hypothetical protein [Chthonomonadaceae bacterium]
MRIVRLAVAIASIVVAAGQALPQPAMSGVQVGGLISSFRPFHITGANRGSSVCPICQYPTNPAVQVWINGDDERNVAAIAGLLEHCTVAHSQSKFKAFLVYCSLDAKHDHALRASLEQVAQSNHLKNVAVVLVSSDNVNGYRDNNINTDPAVRNTVFVYKAARVSAKFVNLVADRRGLANLNAAIYTIVQ